MNSLILIFVVSDDKGASERSQSGSRARRLDLRTQLHHRMTLSAGAIGKEFGLVTSVTELSCSYDDNTTKNYTLYNIKHTAKKFGVLQEQ